MPVAIEADRFGFTSGIYILRLGYRYQSLKKCLMFRAGINPAFIVIIPEIWGGLSIGYAF
jgi:hypothetical protein